MPIVSDWECQWASLKHKQPTSIIPGMLCAGWVVQQQQQQKQQQKKNNNNNHIDIMHNTANHNHFLPIFYSGGVINKDACQVKI